MGSTRAGQVAAVWCQMIKVGNRRYFAYLSLFPFQVHCIRGRKLQSRALQSWDIPLTSVFLEQKGKKDVGAEVYYNYEGKELKYEGFVKQVKGTSLFSGT